MAIPLGVEEQVRPVKTALAVLEAKVAGVTVAWIRDAAVGHFEKPQLAASGPQDLVDPRLVAHHKVLALERVVPDEFFE